jgi:hypothetical protein
MEENWKEIQIYKKKEENTKGSASISIDTG